MFHQGANPYWSSYPLQPDLYRASAGLSSSSIQPELSGSSEVATGHSARIHVRRSSKEEQPESLVPAKARSDSLQGSQTVEPKKPRRTMVFGSIGDSDTRSPSPPEAKPSCGANDAESSDARANDHPIELFPAFSIGVSAGETGPSWSGSRNHLLKFTQRPDGSTADLTNRATLEAPGVGEEQSSDRADSDAPSPKAEISEPRTQATKWEFGTTRHYDITDELHSLPGQQEPEETTLLLDESSREQQQVDALAAPTHRSGSTTKPRVAANGYQVRTTSPLSPSQAGPSLAGCEEESTTSDVWEVKDYGYGFGDVSGSEHAMEIIRQEMLARERQRILDGQKELAKVEQERERERAREMLERERERKEREWEKEPEWERMREQERVTGRPRRGSFTGSYNSYDRGNFRGRRGRGFGGRPFGNRHLGRGGYQHQKLASMPHITPPPFQVNPAASLANHISAYSQPSLLTGYISPTLDPYLPVSATIHPQTGLPVTMAHSMSPFSDTTRTYLLTQLEYYLSPQNMAQDFFLRQRMDDSGWIPISLLASFNRVRNLTTDVALVAEVLRQSNMAEVEGDWVRMSGRQWEQSPNSQLQRTKRGKRKSTNPVRFRNTKPKWRMSMAMLTTRTKKMSSSSSARRQKVHGCQNDGSHDQP
ncbi:hypothetical protein BV22DRAFT_492255 [Leucogyrophana mollusca]|uniref:Uncharacterized protein n=1 Tax=Leucogyrophana mollusca TaxID=85980 RepID=A0ACB8BHE1_9AGAM|nr:hypothetical protein BV22DRAFT_492255 [Leucogyrophana mollusca]